MDLAEKQPTNCQLVTKTNTRGKQTSLRFAINLKCFLVGKKKKLMKLIVPYFIHFAALLTINAGELRGSYFGFACLNIELVGIC